MARANRMTPLLAVIIGGLAGAVGTLAMDLVWYRRHRAAGGEAGFVEWEFSTGAEGVEDAGAPAEVGRRIVESLLQTPLPPRVAGITNDVVHWATGMGWGAAHGLVSRSPSLPVAILGPATGVVAWGTAYGVLGLAGIYKPIWEYEPKTLWKDLSAHLVYGSVTAAMFRLLASRRS